MTDARIPSDPLRPVPAWVRWLGIATIVAMVPLVALGGQTTTRIAGMADPVWPTEPWYLAVNSHEIFKEPRPGFLLEHTHRLAGFVTGFVALLFAIACWGSESNFRRRWMGFAVVLFLVTMYGAFYGSMRQIKDTPDSFGSIQIVTAILTLGCVASVCGLAAVSVKEGKPGSTSRLLAQVGLVCVMIQGLLGGFRVSLNGLFGPNLAIVHGCFAHVVVCIYVAAVVFAGPRNPRKALLEDERSLLQFVTIAGIAVVFLQLIWGALTRHTGTPLAQRLHLLTAFAATGVVLALVVMMRMNDPIRRIFGGYAFHLLAIVGLQVMLGVEAYLGKFAASGPYANLEPRFRPITDSQALIRTGHVLIGLTLLASLVALAVRVSRARRIDESVQQTEPGRDAHSDDLTLEPSAAV